MPECKRSLEVFDERCSIIPVGLTSILQPLDVRVNNLFKDHLQQRRNKWMLDGEHSFTPSGCIKKPDLQLICRWILESWEAISPMTAWSFLKCCITNVLDRMQDVILWQVDIDEEAAVIDEEDLY